MATVTCKAKKNGEVKRRGKPTVEWYAEEEPQYYCYGYIDKSTDEPLDKCKQCPDFVELAQKDLDNYIQNGNKR